MYRALSHTSRRRSPDVAVRWRPEWPVLYRASASVGRLPPAGRRPSLAHSRGRVVSVRRLSRWCRSRCRSRSRARSHARGGGLGDLACELSRVMHAMRTLLSYSHVAGRFVVMRAWRDEEEREDEREERREDETAAKGAECTSGHPGRVAYSDPARAIGVAMRRAWARAWVVWGDTTERQPRTCEWDLAVARYLAFNGRRSGARLAPAVLASRRRRGTDRGRLYFPQRPPAYRAIKLASRGGESESVVCPKDTRGACKSFFSRSIANRRQLLVPSSRRADLKSCAEAFGAPRRRDG